MKPTKMFRMSKADKTMIALAPPDIRSGLKAALISAAVTQEIMAKTSGKVSTPKEENAVD